MYDFRACDALHARAAPSGRLTHSDPKGPVPCRSFGRCFRMVGTVDQRIPNVKTFCFFLEKWCSWSSLCSSFGGARLRFAQSHRTASFDSFGSNARCPRPLGVLGDQTVRGAAPGRRLLIGEGTIGNGVQCGIDVGRLGGDVRRCET